MPAVRPSTERKFWKGLCKLFQGLIDRIKRGNCTPETVQRETEAFLKAPQMNQYMLNVISNMVKTQRAETARSWREAAMQSGQGRMIYQLIAHEMEGPVGQRVAEIITENARFIKTVPQDWANYMVQYSYQESLKGKRTEEVEAELKKIMPQQMHNRIKLIARTECAKANAAIVQARAEMCGIKAYIWRSVTDQRTRDALVEDTDSHLSFNDIQHTYFWCDRRTSSMLTSA